MKPTNNISQLQLEAIDRYLDNSMSAEERLEFDTRLNDDAAFRDEFLNTKALILGIESAGLKAQMEDFHNKMKPVIAMPTEASRNTNNRFLLYSVAASVAVLIGIFWVFNSGNSSEKLFAKHFTPDPGLPTVMSTTNEYEFYDAMVSYKQEDYTTAIKKWEAILPAKPTNDTLNFYLGVSYLAEGNATKASEYLEKTMESKNSIFLEDAYYFAALAQMKNDNIVKAKELLEKSNSPQSQALLKDLIK